MILIYSALLGVAISSFGVSYLVQKELDLENPKTLSQLVAQKQSDLMIFRATIFFGGSLIAFAVFFFIVPKIEYSLSIAISFAVVYLSELLLSIFPDNNSDIFTPNLHRVFGYSMALGMLITATMLSFGLDGTAAHIEVMLVILMLALSLGGILHRKRFIFYELLFIFTSHISVLVAIFALG